MKSLFLAAALSAAAFAAHAADIMAMKPFAYATSASQKAGGAYISLMSHGLTDRLVSAASPVAKRVEIHTHIKDGDVMRMRKVDGPLPLSPDTPIEMAPGGVHVMLMGLNAPLADGATFPVTLTFESGRELQVEVPVVKRDTGHGAGQKHHGHKHKSDG